MPRFLLGIVWVWLLACGNVCAASVWHKSIWAGEPIDSILRSEVSLPAGDYSIQMINLDRLLIVQGVTIIASIAANPESPDATHSVTIPAHDGPLDFYVQTSVVTSSTLGQLIVSAQGLAVLSAQYPVNPVNTNLSTSLSSTLSESGTFQRESVILEDIPALTSVQGAWYGSLDGTDTLLQPDIAPSVSVGPEARLSLRNAQTANAGIVRFNVQSPNFQKYGIKIIHNPSASTHLIELGTITLTPSSSTIQVVQRALREYESIDEPTLLLVPRQFTQAPQSLVGQDTTITLPPGTYDIVSLGETGVVTVAIKTYDRVLWSGVANHGAVALPKWTPGSYAPMAIEWQVGDMYRDTRQILVGIQNGQEMFRLDSSSNTSQSMILQGDYDLVVLHPLNRSVGESRNTFLRRLRELQNRPGRITAKQGDAFVYQAYAHGERWIPIANPAQYPPGRFELKGTAFNVFDRRLDGFNVHVFDVTDEFSFGAGSTVESPDGNIVLPPMDYAAEQKTWLTFFAGLRDDDEGLIGLTMTFTPSDPESDNTGDTPAVGDRSASGNGGSSSGGAVSGVWGALIMLAWRRRHQCRSFWRYLTRQNGFFQ